MKRIALIAALAALPLATACTAPETLTEYRPVVDRPNAAYASDLSQCQALAMQAEEEYKRKQGQEMAANIIAGLIVGAVAGQAYGGNSDYTAYGAAYGATAGAASTDTELAHGGPRRIVDRCLASRGHTVLSDLGRG